MTDQPKMKLTNEQRAKVASHCTGCKARVNPINNQIELPGAFYFSSWAPYGTDYRILTQKSADLARVTGNPSIFLRVLDAIATNNVNDLESLCFELIGESL